MRSVSALHRGVSRADHGMQILPRVGDEVLVEFLDGDIDRPVITGSLYNSASKALFDPTETNKISEITGDGRTIQVCERDT